METETNNQLLVDMKKRMEDLQKTINDLKKRENKAPSYRERPSCGKGGSYTIDRNRNDRKEPTLQSKDNLNR